MVEELKNELIKRFGHVSDKNDLMKSTQACQKTLESTRGFLSRLSGMAHTCFPKDETLRESMLFNKSLKRLNSRIVMNLCSKNFEDIREADMQEEECLKFDKQNMEINVEALI